MSRMPRQRRWWKTLLKFAASVAFGLVLLEGALRVVGFGPTPPLPADVDLATLPTEEVVEIAARHRWIHTPSSETEVELTDEHTTLVMRRNWCGCREDDETPVEKPPGTTRVVVLGDSHTDGVVGNSESYANVLEAMLGAGVDVVNCGQGAKSPYESLWTYQHLYRRFDPDFLVFGFYAGNDVLDVLVQHDRIHLEWDGSRYVHARKTGREDCQYGRRPPAGAIEDFLAAHSAIYTALDRIGWLQTDERILRGQRPPEYFDKLVAARDRFPAATWQGLNQAYFFKHYPGQWDEAAKLLKFIFSELKALAPHGRLAVIVIPSYRQLRPEVVADAADLLELDADDLQSDARACQLALDVCDELQIDALDMRGVMRQSNGKLFWDFDHHINRAAHRLIAEQLAQYFQALARSTAPTRSQTPAANR